MDKKVVNSKQKRYTSVEKEKALLSIAMFGGSCTKAAKYLEDQGHEFSVDTLKGFKRNNRERYHQLTKEAAPQIREVIAAEAESMAMKLNELEIAALERTYATLNELGAKDAAGALRNISTAKAIQIDKANVLRGMPTEIHEKRTPDEIFRSIRQKLGHVIESTAEEIKPPELERKNES